MTLDAPRARVVCRKRLQELATIPFVPFEELFQVSRPAFEVFGTVLRIHPEIRRRPRHQLHYPDGSFRGHCILTNPRFGPGHGSHQFSRQAREVGETVNLFWLTLRRLSALSQHWGRDFLPGSPAAWLYDQHILTGNLDPASIGENYPEAVRGGLGPLRFEVKSVAKEHRLSGGGRRSCQHKRE